MKTILLNQGYTALTAQAGNPSNLLSFNSFTVGDAVSFDLDTNKIVPYGNIVFSGTVANMRYSRISDEHTTLILFIEHDTPEIAIGNIMLYLTTGEAFSISFRDWPFEKLTTNSVASGMKWVLRISMNIPNLSSRFSFTNLIEQSSEWYQYTDEGHLNYPQFEQHDQAHIARHSRTNTLVPLLNVGNVWYGNPLAMRMDDPKFGVRLNGGVVGDYYEYVPNQA